MRVRWGGRESWAHSRNHMVPLATERLRSCAPVFWKGRDLITPQAPEVTYIIAFSRNSFSVGNPEQGLISRSQAFLPCHAPTDVFSHHQEFWRNSKESPKERNAETLPSHVESPLGLPYLRASSAPRLCLYDPSAPSVIPIV